MFPCPYYRASGKLAWRSLSLDSCELYRVMERSRSRLKEIKCEELGKSTHDANAIHAHFPGF
ncbi:MAG: hypothetical protein J7647_02860 [Cyanobacteria bacterium SBLK]|nr:hypothetical protein [Cyanobacteria bacterium SBLK]